MFDIQNYGSFIAAIVVFQLIPGPGTLAILNATARNGIGAGMGAVAGTLLGDLAFMVAAVLGLAAILTANPAVFSTLQWFGIAYLVWLGWGLLRAPVSNAPAAQAPRQSGWVFLRQGFSVALTNPKAIMFFMAFFPLFMTPSARPVTLLAMMAHVTVISLLYQGGLVLIGNVVARRLARVRRARWIATRLAGAALVGFGIKLAAGQR
jgi:threonine/homoserine/homoserine lactone efflux protein